MNEIERTWDQVYADHYDSLVRDGYDDYDARTFAANYADKTCWAMEMEN